MTTSFQNEIPKARVNITLDLETHGSRKKTELPLKLLVLGKLSQNAEKPSISTREKINITKENLNYTMADLSPTLHCTIPNKLNANEDPLPVNLHFTQYADFHPEHIVMQIPELRKLVAMRNLLKELKANIIDNKTLKTELENIIHNQTTLKKMQEELNQLLFQPSI